MCGATHKRALGAVQPQPARILNPRGPSGSGKTELVRRLIEVLAAEGESTGQRSEPIYRPGRTRPIAYRFPHPSRGAPVLVLGHYEKTSGGCDTIRESDGGMDEVFRLADCMASAGHSVVMEGLRLSSDHKRTRALARRHELHILRLTTPVEACSRNLIRRRRLSRSTSPDSCRRAADERLRIDAAVERLSPGTFVHDVDFNEGMRLARRLLGLPEIAAG